MDSKNFLSVQNVSKTFKTKTGTKKQVLNYLCFDIHAQEIVSFLGINGSGKTTLASILATLCPPSEGNILYKGHSIYDDLAAYRYRMGFCQSAPNFNNALSVEQNLVFTGRFFGLTEEASTARAHQLAVQFHFDDYLSESPRDLSGGYIKRIMIARALIHKPKILIIDELSTGLDIHIKQYLWDLIRSLKDEGMTILITTHNMEEAETLSDRICILHKKSIIAFDTPEKIKRHDANRSFATVFAQLTQEEPK